MLPTRTGPIALVLGVATWAQLALTPAVAAAIDPASLALALVALVPLVAAAALHTRSPQRALALALAVYPCALGVAAFAASRHAVPRFDAPSRVVAALTATAYLISATAWYQGQFSRVAVVTAAADDRPGVPPPAFQGIAFAALSLVALTVSVAAPAWLGAREADTVAERIAGETLVRGRGAMVTAVGTLLAVVLVLQGATALLRASPPRARTPSRAAAYGLWAACAWLMRQWLDHAR